MPSAPTGWWVVRTGSAEALRAVDREFEEEAASLALFAFERDVAAMQVGDMPGDCQTRARALLFVVIAVDLVERLEQMALFADRDALPFIADGNGDRVFIRQQADRHGAGFVLRREFDRVFEQVPER